MHQQAPNEISIRSDRRTGDLCLQAARRWSRTSANGSPLMLHPAIRVTHGGAGTGQSVSDLAQAPCQELRSRATQPAIPIVRAAESQSAA
jgi:hypothetical protein